MYSSSFCLAGRKKIAWDLGWFPIASLLFSLPANARIPPSIAAENGQAAGAEIVSSRSINRNRHVAEDLPCAPRLPLPYGEIPVDHLLPVCEAGL
jgi:hypothetical protein